MKEIFSDGLSDIYVARGLAYLDFYHLVPCEDGHLERESFLRITLPLSKKGFFGLVQTGDTVLKHLVRIGMLSEVPVGSEPEKQVAAPAEKKTERKSAKPAPAKKAEAKPAAKPAPAKKAEAKPAAKPAEKPAPAKKAEAKPAAKPAEKPAPAKKAEAKPAAKPAEKPAPAKKAEAKPAAKPAEKPAPAKKAAPAKAPVVKGKKSAK